MSLDSPKSFTAVEKSESPDLDWYTNKSLCRELEVDQNTTKRIADTYRESNPEWFSIPDDSSFEHYSPELVSIIREKIESMRDVPEGWKSVPMLMESLGKSKNFIRRFADKYRESNPEWFGTYKADVGRPKEYFSPELIELIAEKVSKQEKAPADWVTKFEASKKFGITNRTVEVKAETYRNTNPEWFKEYLDSVGRPTEHYAPELVEGLKSDFKDYFERAPEGWRTNGSLFVELGVGQDTVQSSAQKFRDSNPEWFKEFRTDNGLQAEHYSPELVDKIRDDLGLNDISEGWISKTKLAGELGITRKRLNKIISERIDSLNEEQCKRVGAKHGVDVYYFSPKFKHQLTEELSEQEPVPDGWFTKNYMSKDLGVDFGSIEKFAKRYRDEYPDWFKLYKIGNGRVYEHYSPQLVEVIKDNFSKLELAPEGWQTGSKLAVDLGVDRGTILNFLNGLPAGEIQMNSGEYLDSMRRVNTHYSPHIESLLKKKFSNIDNPPQGWMTKTEVRDILRIGDKTLDSLQSEFEEADCTQYFKSKSGRVVQYYSPDFIEFAQKFVKESLAPEGWEIQFRLAKDLNVRTVEIGRIANKYRESDPEWFKKFRTRTSSETEHFSPQLVEIIKDEINNQNQERFRNEALEQKRIETENQCDEFLKSVVEGIKGSPEEFKKLISIFGIEQGFDVLYKYHPEFNGIDVEYVRSSIAKYLGDFLTIRTGVIHEDLELTLPFLTETTYKDSLYESLKSDCLTSFHERKRANTESSEEALLLRYIAEVREKTSSFANDDLNEVIDRVAEFYKGLYSGMDKPGNVIEHLRPGRPFPDINQRLNIREVAEKRRMLIGDEMGMGKSASAILSKEYLGVDRALVIVPSNVVGTWQRYLSDEISHEGKPMGYFEQGQAPRVLVVESEQALAETNPEDYDYVIISQERLNDKYVTRLRDLDCGMVIVDEVHKLKNITEGERSQAALDLITSLDAESAYSVLLSGTPVPNKVGDVAVILKLLYPNRFNDWDNKALTSAIINGDILDLRSLLVPRMQMKSLQESVEMPEKQETTLRTELTPAEEEVYELLLEDDDLTASQKIQVLRKFVMNPASLEITPMLESSKVVDVREHIRSAFEEHDKVVLIVNSYVDGIVKGEDNLLEKLDLPEGVETRVIYGEVSKEERAAIEKEVRESGGKLLLVLSGQTADVGVDFSSADHLVFYNDPWTLYDKQQQAARVYRPGLKHDLDIVTSVTEGTIEEGISEYIETKYKAIEKVLKGVPLTEIEKGLLRTNERQSTMDVEGDLEIAKEWLNSPQNRLHKFFGATKEIGEGKFQEFLQRYGDEYAEYYQEMGSRGFQANTSRVAGALINKFIEERGQTPSEVDILDSASGPFMLERHIADQLQERVYSLDINRSHFDKASEDREEGVRRSIVGSFVELNLPDEDFEYMNMSLAFHYTKLDLRKKNYERLQALKEMNRVLKVGGRAVINFVHSMNLKNPEQFREAVEQLGFQVVEEYTGVASSGDSYASPCIVLEKVEHIDASTEELAGLIGKSGLDGLKLGKSEIPSLKNSRQVVHDFTINGEEIKVPFNLEDVVFALEEQEIFNEARELVKMYGSIGEIPKEEIIERDFLRIRVTKGSGEQSAKYRLFKRGEHAGGFIEFVK